MSVNPDNASYVGFGPQGKIEGTTMDSRFLVANQGMLRFVARTPEWENEESDKKLRILQQYQWSQEEGKFEWYDIPMVTDESG